ncbi:MAG: DUF6504 family protein [Lentisphaeria bacterium]
MSRQFISEAVVPEPGTFDTGRMAAGEPGLPGAFAWRGRRFEVAELLRCWKEAGPCRMGSSEQYVRKHWYEVRTATGETLTLYFERQPRGKAQAKKRWWLFSLADAAGPTDPA